MVMQIKLLVVVINIYVNQNLSNGTSVAREGSRVSGFQIVTAERFVSYYGQPRRVNLYL